MSPQWIIFYLWLLLLTTGGVTFIGSETSTEPPQVMYTDPSEAKKPSEMQKGGKKKKSSFALPWWSIYFAYFLSFCCCGTAFYMTVEVAGVFGPQKSREWLFSFCVSIVESVFFSQPLKVSTSLHWSVIVFLSRYLNVNAKINSKIFFRFLSWLSFMPSSSRNPILMMKNKDQVIMEH